MRISDWSSDVCSSDLEQPFGVAESFFGEDQGLYLVTVCDTCLADFLDAAGRADVPVDPVGRTIKDRIVFELPGSDHQVTLAELREAHEGFRSEEHTSELQSLMRISYAVFCLKKKKH